MQKDSTGGTAESGDVLPKLPEDLRNAVLLVIMDKTVSCITFLRVNHTHPFPVFVMSQMPPVLFAALMACQQGNESHTHSHTHVRSSYAFSGAMLGKS